MELMLHRRYAQQGSNGILTLPVCHMIELPWHDNTRGLSCIPEGRYELRERFSERFQAHFLVMDVPGRSGILIHPANDALRELKGCLAPVTTLTGPGRGSGSRMAHAWLKAVVRLALDRNEKVFLTIKPSEHECDATGESTHT